MRHLLLALFFLTGALLPAQEWNLVPFGPETGLPRGTVDRVSAAETGAVFARTAGGWYRFDGRSFSPAEGPPEVAVDAGRLPEAVRTTLAQQQPDARLLAATPDRQNRWWLATDRGLFRAVPTPFRRYGAAEGLTDPRVTLLAEIGDDLIVATAGQDVFRLRDDRLTPAFPELGRLPPLTALVAGTDGRVYFGTRNDGLLVGGDREFTRLSVRSGLADGEVIALLADSTGGVWVLGGSGVLQSVRYPDSTVVIETAPGLEGRYRSLLRLPDDRFLLGGEDGSLTRWSPADTLPVVLPTGVDEPITGLAERWGRQVWVTTGSGLYVTDLTADSPRLAPIAPAEDNWTEGPTRLLALDRQREVWAGDGRGLHRLFLTNDGRPDWQKFYGPSEGLTGDFSRYGAVLTDRNGQLWFGTDRGLFAFAGDNRNDYLAPPPVRITGVRQDFTPVGDRRSFDARENSFVFEFAAVELTHPERLRYRWRLWRLEERWSPVSAQTSTRYAGLPPGNYRFEVAATTDGGKTFSQPTAFAFEIQNPVWRTAWFLGLVALAGSALLVGIYAATARRIRREEQRKRTELEARNTVLELEQRALRLQMNPHFIFNALNGIRGLIDGAHDAEARQQITRFATLMRGILNNSRSETITLAEEVQVLNDYLEMERFCQPFDFTFTIGVATGGNPEEIGLPPMLVQPFVENAVLHGLSGRPTPGHISVTFRAAARGMQCLIEDDGIGRAAAEARNLHRNPTHRSVATDVTRDRLRAIGGNMHIEDLTEDGGRATGTRVTLTFPVTENW